jgi:hypothetical protein
MTDLWHLFSDISSGHHVDLTHRPTIGFKSKLEVIEFFYKIIVSIQSKELDSQRQYGAAAQLKGDHEAMKGTSKKTSTRRREVPSSKKRSHRAEQEKPKEAAATADPPGRPSETREESAFSEYLSAATSCLQYLLMLVALYTATAMCGGHYLRAFKAKAASSKPVNKRHAPAGIPTKHCAVSSQPDHTDSRPDGEPSRCLRNVTGTHLAHRSILAIQLFVEAQQSNMVLFNQEVAVRGTEQYRLLAKLLGHYLLWGCSYCSQLLGSSNPSRTMDDAAKLAEDLLFPGVKPTGSQGPTPLWMGSFTDTATDLMDSTRHAASKKSQHSKLKNRAGKTQLKLNKSASGPMYSTDEMKAPATATVEEEDRPAADNAAPISAASESSGGDRFDALLEEVVDHSRTAESLVEDRSDKKAVEDPGCTSDESLVFSSMYRDDGLLPDDDDEGWISIRSSANSQRPQRAPRPAVTYVRLQTRRPIRKADTSDCQAPAYSSRATVSHPAGDCLRINHTSTKPIDHNRSPKTLPVKDTVELDSSSTSAGANIAVDASLHCNVSSSDSSHLKDSSRGIRSSRTTYSPRYNAPHKNPLKYNNSHSSKKVLNSFSRPADIMSYRQSSVPITLSSSSKGIEQPMVVCATESHGSNSPDPAGGQLEDADPTEHSSLSDNASETTSHEDCSTLHTQHLQQQQPTTHSPDSVFTFPHQLVHSDNAQPSMTFYSVPVQQQQQQQTGYSQQMSYQQQQGYPMMPTMGMPYPASYTIQLPPNAPTPSVAHAPMGDLPTNESAPPCSYSEAAPPRDPSSSALTIQLPIADSYVYPTPHFSPTHYFSPTMYPHGSYYPSNFVFASRTPSPNQQVVTAPRHVISLTD